MLYSIQIRRWPSAVPSMYIIIRCKMAIIVLGKIVARIFALVIFGLYQCMAKIIKSHKNEQNLEQFFAIQTQQGFSERTAHDWKPYKIYTIHNRDILQRLSFLQRLSAI